jgi:hypothetical protein
VAEPPPPAAEEERGVAGAEVVVAVGRVVAVACFSCVSP